MRTGLVCSGIFRICVKIVGADKHVGFLRNVMSVLWARICNSTNAAFSAGEDRYLVELGVPASKLDVSWG